MTGTPDATDTQTDRDNREARMTRLEEGLFFQERLLEGLNAALTLQQRQLDQMEKELTGLREKVLELNLSLDAAEGAVNTPPPHYNGD